MVVSWKPMQDLPALRTWISVHVHSCVDEWPCSFGTSQSPRLHYSM